MKKNVRVYLDSLDGFFLAASLNMSYIPSKGETFRVDKFAQEEPLDDVNLRVRHVHIEYTGDEEIFKIFAEITDEYAALANMHV